MNDTVFVLEITNMGLEQNFQVMSENFLIEKIHANAY
jgi:hypothetical protein